ncbi:MAG TPA: nuclear transport factor 2 family protein [Candidatus Saccharimonadales bacterium]|nr:nuclear transport factor 2 family protein [Candidatus Saccharimonadales bacterium]
MRIAKDDALTLALAERIQQVWEAYLAKDAPAHNALLADDYHAVHPDGSMHPDKPTAAEISAAPIEEFWLREIQAWPVGEEGAIATYTAEVEVRRELHAERHQFAVGEVWMKHSGQWLCRYYHATPLQ